ncbi:MAG: putative toxin-antitoxin system toxin component, PIN family [Chitinispirillales bacterium]|jgi:putative PIN family toxin of toxin-antitoxin system|nr:putative toxin-antitoxin system toxin component, PIN family [Chitinispirillales bacterium]
MKLVLDANVLISAYFWRGNPHTVFNRIIDGLDSLFITDEIVDEIGCVIRKPRFHATIEQINGFMAGVLELGQKIAVSPHDRVIGVCRDPDDEKYIECAVTGKVDYIISGDRDLLDIKRYNDVRIISAREYLDIVTQYKKGTI